MKGLRVNPFNDSLLQDRLETMVEVCRRATTHIDAEETMKQKRAEEWQPLAKFQPHSDMSREDMIHLRFQKDEHRYIPYAASEPSRKERNLRKG